MAAILIRAGFVEQVVTCAHCGARSSDDLSGRKHWQMVTRSALIVIDLCPECFKLHPKTETKS